MRAEQWLTRFEGRVGSPPYAEPVGTPDVALTAVYAASVAWLVLRAATGGTAWMVFPLTVVGSALALHALGGRNGLRWPLRMLLVALGDPPPCYSSRFVNRPSGRTPFVVRLQGDHPHLDEGDLVRMLAVPVGGARRVLWICHRTSGRRWFASWLGWSTLYAVLGLAALICS